VTSTNTIPRCGAQNGRSSVDLGKYTGKSLGGFYSAAIFSTPPHGNKMSRTNDAREVAMMEDQDGVADDATESDAPHAK
jgi:hypothetical protein